MYSTVQLYHTLYSTVYMYLTLYCTVKLYPTLYVQYIFFSRHGYVERRPEPLSDKELVAAYSQGKRRDFSKYNYTAFKNVSLGFINVIFFT